MLGRLDRNGPQTIAQLASWRGVRHQSMSRMIAELEQLDLIDRAPNPSDRRGFVIAISRAGRAALDRDRRGRRDLLATAIRTRLSKEERRALAAIPGILDKLRTV
ncbi:MAG TPA: MarR family transcriptional regulator [Pseudonocardiaceae bacterium]